MSEAVLKAGRVTIGEEHEGFRWVKKEDIFSLDLAESSKLPLTEIFLKERGLPRPEPILKRVKHKRKRRIVR